MYEYGEHPKDNQKEDKEIDQIIKNVCEHFNQEGKFSKYTNEETQFNET